MNVNEPWNVIDLHKIEEVLITDNKNEKRGKYFLSSSNEKTLACLGSFLRVCIKIKFNK